MKHKVSFLSAACALILGCSLAATSASAITVDDYSFQGTTGGNDCDGVLGNVPDCTLDGSPLIVKIEFDDDGNVSGFEFGNFSSIDGSEFSFDFGNDAGTGTGTWVYTPDDATDPGITGFTAKGGPSFNTFTKDGSAFIGVGDQSVYFTPTVGSGPNPQPAGLSHITFFDSTVAVPLPAAGWLLIGGAGALGMLRRRRKG